MNRHIFIIVAIAINSVVLVAPSLGSGVYWTFHPKKPVVIAIGTIKEIVPDAWEHRSPRKQNGSDLYFVGNNGLLELEEILWGKPDKKSVWISWYARTRLEPLLEYVIISSATRKVELGETNIWVLWDKAAAGKYWNESTPDGFYQWSRVNMIDLDRVKADILEHCVQ